MSEDGKDSNATKVYSTGSDDALKTMAYGSEAGQRTDRTSTHNLGTGDTVSLAGMEYRIERILSGENKTGEALIYLIRNNSGSDYCLKMYYPFRNPRDEPNAEALKRIMDIDNPDILKLYHFGTGPEKYLGQFCYEISDYAKGGDLLRVDNIKKKYTPAFVERHVIQEIFKGIQILHDQRIYHCDLKPQNIFYLDEKQTNLVIGDYGSAKTFEQSSEKELTYMSMVKGTDFYIAPEQAIGIISEKNDYYSFGMIVLHLLYPEKIDQQTLRMIYERRASEKPIIDYEPKYKRLNDLIAGLTLQDIQQRWGQKEISQWLSGKSVPVNYQKAATYTVAPINVGKTTIQTEDELINYVEQDNEWYRYLIEDEQGYQLLLSWLSQHQNIESKQRFDKLMRIAVPKGLRFGQEALIRFFRPERPVKLISQFDIFHTEDPETLTKNFLRELDDHWKITDLKQMSWYLFCFGMALEQYTASVSDEKKKEAERILSRLSNIGQGAVDNKVLKKKGGRSNKKEPKDVPTDRTDNIPATEWGFLLMEVTDQKILRLIYEFNPDRTFRDRTGKSYDTVEQVGLFFAADPDLWEDRFLKEERLQFLKKINQHQLSSPDRSKFLLKVFENQTSLAIKITHLEPLGDSDTVNVVYKVHRSLEDFFEQHGISDHVKEEIESGNTRISNFTKEEIDASCSKFLNGVERRHDLPANKWAKSLLDMLRGKFTDYKSKHIKEAVIQSRLRMKEDARYAVKSFIFLLPVLFLFFVILAYYEKSFKLINFLSHFTPFTLSFDRAFISKTALGNRFGLFFLSTLFLAPSLFLALRRIGPLASFGWLFFGAILMGLFITILPLPGAGICIIGITIWIYASPSNRIRLRPFLISVLPILLLAFIGDFTFKDTPPSAKVARPLNVSVELRSDKLVYALGLSLRSGPSDHYAVTGTAYYKDIVNVVAEDAGWYLIQDKENEGYVPAEIIGSLGYLKTKDRAPSSDASHPMNFLVSAETEIDCMIRAGTSKAYAVLGAMHKNDTATVISQHGDWYLIHHKGVEGYIEIQNVEPIVIMRGRSIQRKQMLKSEPSYTSKTKERQWYNDHHFDILAVHNDWYLVYSSFYNELGYVSKNDVRILKK